MCISDWSSDVCSSDLAEVDLAVDVLFPAERLARVLRAFANEYPTVSLRLNVEALGAVVAMVLDGKAVAGLSGPLAADVEEIGRMSAGSETGRGSGRGRMWQYVVSRGVCGPLKNNKERKI